MLYNKKVYYTAHPNILDADAAIQDCAPLCTVRVSGDHVR